MPPSRNGQWEVAGLLIGEGTSYPVNEVQGLAAPGYKSVDLALSDRDGGWSGVDRLEAREILMQIGIDGGGPDTSGYGNLVDDLMEAWAPRSDDITVIWQRFGRRRRVLARPRGLVFNWDDQFHFGLAMCAGRLVCADPVIYDDTETVVVDDGTFPVTNSGNYPTWATVLIDDPTPAVTIRNTTDGNRGMSLVDLPGDTTVDLKRKTVSSGGNDWFSKVQPGATWFRILPGVNNLDFTGATSFTVTFRSGWISG